MKTAYVHTTLATQKKGGHYFEGNVTQGFHSAMFYHTTYTTILFLAFHRQSIFLLIDDF